MLIVLPPSETKAVGGNGAPLEFSALSFPTLTATRSDIAQDLVQLADDADEAMRVLKLGPKLASEVAANAELLTAPTMPALDRYTGVLFDALDAKALPAQARAQLAVGSALFGVVRAEDHIPRYRLSGTTKLPRRGASPDSTTPTMRARWGSTITEALADEAFLIDLRSGTYLNLGKVKSAVTATVVTREGKVVSHFNKHHKGVLARELVLASTPPTTVEDAVEIACEAGMDASVVDGHIRIVVD